MMGPKEQLAHKEQQVVVVLLELKEQQAHKELLEVQEHKELKEKVVE